MGKDKKFRKHFKPYDRKTAKSVGKTKLEEQSDSNLLDAIRNSKKDGDALSNKQNVVPKECLRENQVGITEFLGSSSGFVGVLKSRFSDFHVNEIDMNGQVLYLTDVNVPKTDASKMSSKEIAAMKKSMSDIITPEVWKKIDDLAHKKDEKQPIELDVSSYDKEKRGKLHLLIKLKYADKLRAHTRPSTVDNIRIFEILKCDKTAPEKRTQHQMEAPFVHFTLHKVNLDTSQVVSMLARSMKLPTSSISYAGNKDRRAVTTQKFCIKRRNPAQIVKAMDNMNRVHAGNFELHKTSLRLGQLQGNKFRIAVRHIHGDEDQIELALKELQTQGFINYYGMQRFGNCVEVPTHVVGMAILKCDYKLAIELILKPREQEQAQMAAAREKWWKERDSQEAAKMLSGSNKNSIEKRVLLGLAKCGENNYKGALDRIPRNILTLYIHAWQSLIFNKMASRRIKEFGLQPMPGDLVYADNTQTDEPVADVDNLDVVQCMEQEEQEKEDENMVNEDEHMEQADQEKYVEITEQAQQEKDAEITEQAQQEKDVEITEQAQQEKDVEITEQTQQEKDVEITEQTQQEKDVENTEQTQQEKDVENTEQEQKEKDVKSTDTKSAENAARQSEFKNKVKPLSADDIATGKYSIFDIVLPLPGYDITYPTNIMAQWYTDELASFELTSANLKHKIRGLQLGGAYRKLIIKPLQLSWNYAYYDDVDSNLIASDWEILQKDTKVLDEVAKNVNASSGKYKALLVDIDLPSSTYATMCLRQLLKSDTSAGNQTQLEKDALNDSKPAEEVQPKRKQLPQVVIKW